VSQLSAEESALLRKRHRADKRFKAYTVIALLLALAFLLFFFFDIITQGVSAFRTTHLLVEVSYNEQSLENPNWAVTEEVEYYVSRSFLRLIPNKIEDNPELMNTSREQWVLADSDVDMYMKGQATRLGPDDKAYIDQMREEGRAKLVFNKLFFTTGDSTMPEAAGILSAAVGSVFVLTLVLVFCFPLGVLTAIYLEEFAPDNKLTQAIEVNINNLAAIPSILFGLLGLALFINIMDVPRSSALVGGLTLSLMTLPIIIISSRAALRAVPYSIRLAAMSMGATRWQAVVHHVLPQSISGMLTGAIIGLAQAMGETAPLIIVGMIAFIPATPETVADPTTVLPAQIFKWWGNSLRGFSEKAAAGIIVLLVILLAMNALAVLLRARFERRW
jgi:phosphate transport system permease protein